MTARLLIFGFVQGVGYRRFVKAKALRLGLKGFVRNLSDNRVEAVFSGPKSVIEQMIKICQKGPFLSEVKHIDLKWLKKDENFEDFIILK